MSKVEFTLETSISERTQHFITCKYINPFLMIQLLLAPIGTEKLKFSELSALAFASNFISIHMSLPTLPQERLYLL